MWKGNPDVYEERYEFFGKPMPNSSPYDGTIGVVANAGLGLPRNGGAYGDALGYGLLANVL